MSVSRLTSDGAIMKFLSVTAIDAALELIVKGVEDAAEGYCNRKFAHATYTDEAYLIGSDKLTKTFDNKVTQPRIEFTLRQAPVTKLTSVKQVTEHKSDGSVTVSALSATAYCLVPESRIVRFLAPSGLLPSYTYQPDFWGAPILPTMTNALELRVTYEAGWTEIPNDLQLFICMVISRIWKINQSMGFHMQSIASNFATTMLSRVDFTPEEKMILGGYRLSLFGA